MYEKCLFLSSTYPLQKLARDDISDLHYLLFLKGHTLFFKKELFRNLKAKNQRNKIAFLQSFGNSNSFFYFISSTFSQPKTKIDKRAVE